MLKETKKGQTGFCQACAYEAKYKKQKADDFNLKHSCGVKKENCDCKEMSCKKDCP